VKISYPLVVLNFKNYGEAIGSRCLKLAKIAEKVSLDTGVTVAVCPNFVDLEKIARSVAIPVLAQHCDPYEPGAFTGSVVAENLREAKVSGSLLNHSEKRLKLSAIAAAVARLKRVGLFSLVCADDVSSAAAASALNPDALAIEPPELIGTGVSVSTARPEVVTKTVASVRKLNKEVHILCGAGVSTPDDVKKAILLGTEGVLLSSAYVKSRDPETLLRKMCEFSLV